MAFLRNTVRPCCTSLVGLNSSNLCGVPALAALRIRPMAAIADRQGESFWDKNKRLERPMSPHLTIYKWELTMNMSLMHRTTGLMLTSGIYGFALTMLALPDSFPHYVGVIKALQVSPALIYAAKFTLAFPLVFHACSGTRHLFWDLGKGFNLKSVYASGYAAIAVALGMTALIASW